jgi:DNA-binding NtrC family response regulator
MAASARINVAPKKKVLLVVANMSKRNLRASVLRKLGMDVVCAAQVSDARMLWHPSTYDLVLFDTRSDNASAIELCSDMKAESPAQRVAWLVGKPEFLSAAPCADDSGAAEISSRCEENVRQLMTNACEALPRRGGFLEARWRMALTRSVKPEMQSSRPQTLPALPVVHEPSSGTSQVSFGDAVRQAEADQEDSIA